MEKFDLVIIGGGAAAFAAAIRANELEVKTAMVNSGLPLGGTCVNVGCVPSKTLLWAGEILHQAKNHQISGIKLELRDFDFQKVVKDELNLVDHLRWEKYENVLRNLDKVQSIEGKVKFVSGDEVEIESRQNPSPQRVRGKKFVIAAGSTANIPPIEGIKEVGFLTHIEALKLKKQPQELVVVGAGPLGLEFGQMFARFGSRVTILQKGSSIFPPAEQELTDRLVEILKSEAIAIKTDVEIKKARRDKDKKVILYSANGRIEELATEEILLAAGKTANTQGLDLDKAEVKIDQKKAIIVSKFYQTSQSHIFAAGDVTNMPLRLEPTAGNEGTLATENALTGSKKSIDYNIVPYTIFTDPQLSAVGYTEARQIEKIGVCACRTVSFNDVPKAKIMRRTEGLIKMTIHPETKEITGVHILAPQASELINQAMILVKNKNTIDEVVNSLPIFPSLSEAIKLVALSFSRDISKLSCCI